MKEIKDENNIILKAEKSELISELEKKAGKLERIEKRKLEKIEKGKNKKSLDKPITRIQWAIYTPIIIGIASSFFTLILDNLILQILIGIYVAIIMWILSGVYLIVFDYIIPRSLKKNCISLKLEIQEIEIKKEVILFLDKKILI